MVYESAGTKIKYHNVRLHAENYDEFRQWMHENYIDTPNMAIKKLLDIAKRESEAEA